jgi:hypothetical protein
MSTSQRVSRGFHRLGMFLAAIPLLIGIVATGVIGNEQVLLRYYKARCAHEYLTRERLLLSDDEMKEVKPWQVPWQLYEKVPVGAMVGPYNKDWEIKLKQIGCADWDYETVTYWEARNLYGALFSNVAQLLVIGVAATLAVSLAVYGIVRATGWVIGGFMAS